jgi:hypothetical protein
MDASRIVLLAQHAGHQLHPGLDGRGLPVHLVAAVQREHPLRPRLGEQPVDRDPARAEVLVHRATDAHHGVAHTGQRVMR